MTIVRTGRRKFLKSVAATGAATLLQPCWAPLVRAQAPAAADLDGLRAKIDHIVVIYQENRSFDHYFGAYQPSGGATVDGLLDRDGRIDARFVGLQKSATGAPYTYLPVPYQIPGFANAVLENQPFHLSPYIPSAHNVPWDPMHHFFRMFAQVDGGKMDYFVALALPGPHLFFDKSRKLSVGQMMLAESTPSGAVLGYYTRDDLPATIAWPTSTCCSTTSSRRCRADRPATRSISSRRGPPCHRNLADRGVQLSGHL
jgi:phospholipase C